MQKGLNDFTFLCTDISGSPMTGITSGGFNLFGSIGAANISTFTKSIVEESLGYYTLTLDLNTTGQGYFGITPVAAGVYVTPTFFDTGNIESNDFDSLYSLFLTLQQEGTVDSVENFVTVITSPFKESDDITLNYVVSTDITPTLTGWTAFKAQLRDETSLTTASSGSLLGLATVKVVDALTNSVTIDISGTFTTGIVPEGSYSVNTYMDLEAVNPSGKKKTLMEFTIPINREITRA